MKIRTDFVTNSSSASYITIIIICKDGKRFSIQSEETSCFGDDLCDIVWKPSDGIDELIKALREKDVDINFKDVGGAKSLKKELLKHGGIENAREIDLKWEQWESGEDSPDEEMLCIYNQ